MREKYSFIGMPHVLHDFDTPWVEWLYILWQPTKESYNILI